MRVGTRPDSEALFSLTLLLSYPAGLAASIGGNALISAESH